MHAWAPEGEPLRMVEQSVAKEDADAKALSCYGMLVRYQDEMGEDSQGLWLRFVDGRPVSELTVAFLEYACEKVEALGKGVLALVWDNAGWHTSKRLRSWVRGHNHQVKAAGRGVRIIVCPLPVKSPWLNPIEPHWMHGKRRVAQADRLLSAREIEERACACFGCQLEPHLTLAQEAA